MLNLKKLLTNILLRDIRTVKETVSVPAISPGGYTNVAVSAPATDPDESIIGWRLIAKDGAYRYARDLEIKEKDRRNNMEKVTLSFSAKGQSLTGCPFKFASNTVNYIEAKFELGENWGGFDSVRAVWFTDFNCISTVLDTDGVCVVPHEVLNKAKREVKVNLVGSIVENGELTDRLTTYPIKAIIIDANAKICGSETAEVTPSQFEQFVEAVKAEVAKIKDIDSVELNDDYTLTIYFSDDTETTVGPIRGEQGPAGPQGEQGETGNGIASIEKTGTAGYVDTYTITFTDGTTTTFEVRNGEVSLETLESLMPIDTASGDIASFPDGQNVFPLKSLVADIDPIQDLHGYDAPWVGGAGKNKLDLSTYLKTNNASVVASGNGVKITSTASGNSCYAVYQLPISLLGQTLTLSCDVTVSSTNAPAVRVYFGNDYNNNVGSSLIKVEGTGHLESSNTIPNALPENATKLILIMYCVTSIGATGEGLYATFNNLQLELGSSATTWTPYSNICPISGHDEVTVTVADDVDNPTVSEDYTTTLPSTTYGGTLDLVSGELTVTHVKWTGNTADMDNNNDYPGWNNAGIATLMGTGVNVLYPNIWTNVGRGLGVNTTGANDLLILPKPYYGLTQTEWIALAEDIEVLIELATPQTYQLTPQEIQTLLGVNNIWADSGDVEVVYIADIKLYVDNH